MDFYSIFDNIQNKDINIVQMKIQEIILQIVEGNNLFTKSHQWEYYESFKTEQRPYSHRKR